MNESEAQVTKPIKRENTTHVLILGAGVMQQPAIDAARRMGWQVTVADGSDSASGITWADRFLHVDLADAEGMSAAAAELHAREQLDGVFTAGTDFSYTVARVAKRLGLPGVDPEAALRASDKVRMREAFAEAGVPSPRFVMYTAEPTGDEATKGPAGSILEAMTAGGVGFPVVVKPVDNMGARGVRRADSTEELAEALPAAVADSRSGRAIVEEFIPGQEFSLDALVQEGRVTVCGFADRHIRFPPYFVEMGHTMPTAAETHVCRQVEEVFSRAVRALGIRNGQAKGDIKWDGEKAVVGEVAARLSGGYMSGWTYPYASGIDLTAAALRQAVGLPPGDLAPARNHVTAERAFISIPGRVAALEEFEAARAGLHVKEAFTRIAPGSEVRFPSNNVEKCGNFIASAPARSEAMEAAEEACRSVFVRLVPGDPRTFAFLFGGDIAWAPDAFPLRSEVNRRRLKGMYGIRLSETRDGTCEDHRQLRVGVLAFPERVEAVDWHGTSWERALREVQRRSTARVEFVARELADFSGEEPPQLLLGRTFWRALIRGGVQGAVWTIDTLCEEFCRGKLHSRWEELR